MLPKGSPNKKRFPLSLIFLIVLIGGFLRFYNFFWGDGYFFHPDERNIAGVAFSISPPINFKFFTKGTFSYGSFIPYLVFGIDFLWRTFIPNFLPKDHFALILLLLRVTSAFFSTLTVFLIYLVGSNFWNKKLGLLAATLLAFSPGAIQAAHFGTFESILSFLYLLTLFCTLKLIKNKNSKYFFLSIVVAAIASVIKINSLIFFPLTILIFLIVRQIKHQPFIKTFTAIVLSFFIFIPLVVTLSPYYLTRDFRGLLNYEQSLVRGKLDVFYTRSFFETKPIFFQLFKILPFITNPLVVLFLPFLISGSLLKMLVSILRKGFSLEKITNELIVLAFLAILFLPNAFLFAKWTRYMVPTLPFFCLLTSVYLEKIPFKKWQKLILSLLVATSIVWGCAFMSIYLHKDTRVSASEWIYQNIEDNAFIFTETANVVDIPIPSGKVPSKNYSMVTFDFYGLEKNNFLFNELVSALAKSDYIFIPSRRIFGGMGQFPEKYPTVSHYYQLLFTGGLGFKEIKRFTSYPRLFSIEFPDESAEETWSVFDHPVIRIYKRVKNLSRESYENLLRDSFNSSSL